MILTAEQILAHADTRLETIDVPALGGEVMIGRLSVAEADRVARLGNDTPAVAEIVVLGCRTETGARLFGQDKLEALAKMPADILAPVANAILRFNGLGGGEDPAAKGKGKPAKNP